MLPRACTTSPVDSAPIVRIVLSSHGAPLRAEDLGVFYLSFSNDRDMIKYPSYTVLGED